MTAAHEPAFPAPQGSQASTDITATPPAPAASTAIQAGPPDAETRIPLPPLTVPPKRQTTPEELANEIRRLDWGLAGLVLVLAFLLASFAVRNTDFWQHLASGRLYAHGQFNFGVDPFTYTTAGTYWANHAWLYDLLVYGLAMLFGGPDSAFAGAALVVLKALLITGMAWCMLRTRRPGQSLWAPAACTALAVVAMSSRLLFQPTMVSLLFLALTVYLLQSARHEEGGDRRTSAGKRSPLANYWLLPPLFILWVNLDGWFLLGPLTVALFLVGQALQQVFAPVRTGPDAPEPNQLRTLAVVLVSGLAVCLLNPHHYRAFTLPASLYTTAPTEVFDRDLMLRTFFLSPFEEDYFLPGLGWTVAGFAYFPLLGLGLVSFVLSYFRGWRWWRLLVWLAFAVLAAYRVRNVPFFAVVAGPITALNLQDFAAGMFGRVHRVSPVWKTWSLGGRILTLLAGVVLLLGAWPGWLHARIGEARPAHRIAWRVEVDPSLRQAAEQLNAWHTDGLLQPDDHGFNYSPDVVNYCAWFCADAQGVPREKGFFDYRIGAFSPDVAAQYVDVRQALNPLAMARDPSQRIIDWQAILRKHHINHLVLNRYAGLDFANVWPGLLQDWGQWHLLYLDGRTCIFRWQDRDRRLVTALAKVPRFDPNLLAFGPVPETAPAAGPEQGPQVPDLWTRFLHGPPAESLDQEKSDRYYEYYHIISRMWGGPFLVGSQFGLTVGTVGAAPLSPGTATVAAPGVALLQLYPREAALRGSQFALGLYFRDKDTGPAALPLLAVRAARRAVQASPDNGRGYFSLARGYNDLWLPQEERWVGRQVNARALVPRQRLRQIQITAALEHSLKLRPDDDEAHYLLYQVYGYTNYLDLALLHLQEFVKALGPQPNETREDYGKRMEAWGKEVKALETDVQRQRDEYENAQLNQPTYDKARVALGLGLGGKALEVLLEASELEMQDREANLQLYLLLTTGRTEDVRERLKPELRSVLGADYDWYSTLLEAATGNYEEAGKYLDENITRLEKVATANILMVLQAQMFSKSPRPDLQPGNLQTLNSLLDLLRQAADYRVLRGMLALEQGDPATAARVFQRALDTNNGQPFDFESRQIAVHYLKFLKGEGGRADAPK